jgi:hypothetical protein
MQGERGPRTYGVVGPVSDPGAEEANDRSSDEVGSVVPVVHGSRNGN